MQFQAEYGQAANFYIPVIKAGVNDFAVSADWTPAAGDVKVSIDGAAAANITTLPTAVVMGNGAMWQFALSAAELSGKRIAITVVDAATKAVEDQMFVVGTLYHPSALDPRGVVRSATAQAGAAQTITLDASASATDDAYNGHFLEVVAGTGSGQAGFITDYVGATKVATMERAWVTTPDATSRFRLSAGMLGSTLAEIADANHDELLSGHATAGSAGKALSDAGLAYADTQILLASDLVYKKNTAVTAFTFYMEATDGSPATGKTVTAKLSLDGAAFAAPAGAVTEISDGWYEVDFTAAEFNGDEIAFIATAAGCKQTNCKIRTQS